MNKIVVIGLLAFLFTAAFVDGQDAYTSETSSKTSSSNPFSEESSSSSIIPPEPPTSSSLFPSSSSSSNDFSDSSAPVTCKAGTYYDAKLKKCVGCSSPLMCKTCSNGYSCDSCGTNHDLRNGVCVLKCSDKYGEGCDECSERRCTHCTAEACCKLMKWFFNGTCVNPADVYGEGCLECDDKKCTKCTAQTCCAQDKSEYYDYIHQTCKACTEFGSKCEECTFGGCSKCANNTLIDGKGKCQTCESLFGNGCSECNANECTAAAAGYFVYGTNALSCARFGEKCTECTSAGCSACSDGQVVIGGYCKSCSEAFGANCAQCDSDTCTSCVADSNTFLVNGVCVPCDEAFGAGCNACDMQNNCTAKKDGYFVYNNFAFNCDIIDDFDENFHCKYGDWPKRDIYLKHARADGVTAYYNDIEYSVSCAQMVANCSDCDENGCLECSAGYILYGGYCEECSALHGDECLECSVKSCTQCATDYHVSVDGKCVKCEGETPLFDETTKTCIGVATKFANCKQSTTEKCEVCDDGYYVDTDGKCKTCMSLHHTGCNKCTKDQCTECTSDECCAPGTQIIVGKSGVKCAACSEFDAKCSKCSETQCTECAEGLFVHEESHACVGCDDMFAGCGKCNADKCTACTQASWILTDNGCYEKTDESSSHTQQSSQPQQSSKAPIKKSSSTEEDDGNIAGMVVGIVIGCLAAIAIVGIAIYCVATSGSKHGKIDPVIYEEDPDFITMSVL